jgi:hypothetical protein
MTKRCAAVAPIIVHANNTAPSVAVRGINNKTAQIISRPPVKYRNHWPNPIFANNSFQNAAPEPNLLAPKYRNATAKKPCNTQDVIFATRHHETVILESEPDTRNHLDDLSSH